MKFQLILMFLSLAFISCVPAQKAVAPGEKTISQGSISQTSLSASDVYRAINLNGSGFNYNGINFESSTGASNLVIQGTPFEKQDVPLSPLADSSLSQMIRSSVWGFGGQVSVKMSQVPAGDYNVYLYVWEDNNSEVFSVLLNGVVVHKDVVSGAAGSWKKLGPWKRTVNDGLIHITTTGGAANLSGLEVHKIPVVTTSPSMPSNLIANPGFDESISSWSNLGNAIRVATPVQSGAGALRVGTAAGGVLQYLTLKPGASYDLSGHARVGAAGEVGNFGVTFKNSTGEEIINYQFKVTETVFTKKSLSFTAPAAFAKAEVWVYKATGPSYLYVDDLVLTEKSAPVVASCEGMGSITHEKWDAVSGTTISSIPLNTTATSTKNISQLEISNLGDSYGTRLSGFICAPVSGNYTFYISGDDDTKLSISSNESPLGLTQVAGFSGWTNYRETTKLAGQKSSPVFLTAGKKYYIEVLHKEGGGDDHVTVGWEMPDGKKEFPLPASRLAPKPSTSTPVPPPAPIACSSEGKITLEKIANITSTDPLDLNGKVATSVSTRDLFEAPSNIGDNFGHRMSGLICVPTTGAYSFYVAGDNQVKLFLSTDDKRENKKEIAYHNGWTNPREYTKYPTQTSAAITLQAGKKYYIEALQVEQAGGDNLSVGWKLPNGSLERPIPGSRLSTNPFLGQPPVTQPDVPVAGTAPSRSDSFNPNAITYASPLVITKGGTYRGNWQSANSGVPAIWVKTTEPVIIENSVIRGAGILIFADPNGANLTVRNSRGYVLPFTEHLFNDGNGNNYRAARRFLVAENFKNIVIENNYMEQAAGIYLAGTHRYSSSTDGVKVRYNKVKNIDGRLYGGSSTLVNFFQFNMAGGVVQNADIAYNQVINEAQNSLVEDNINIFNTRGTASNPIKIHNNYIEGAFPIIKPDGTLLGKAYGDNYSGGGIIADSPGDRGDATKITAYMEVTDNQVVGSMNYSFGVATGQYIKFLRNRAVISDYVYDGRKAHDIYPDYAQYKYRVFPNGYWSHDYYKTGNTHSILFDGNLCGVSRFGERIDTFELNPGTTITNHKIMPPGPITLDILKNEYAIFADKIKSKGIILGPK